MSEPWLVITDSEGLVARAIIHKDTVDLECWPSRGNTVYTKVIATGDDAAGPGFSAMASYYMAQAIRSVEQEPAFFVVSGSCRDFVIGFRFFDDKDQKYRWHLCEGWMPDGKESVSVRAGYLKSSPRLDDAVDQAIWHMIAKVTGEGDGTERSEG
jgi:hypothetical protein